MSLFKTLRESPQVFFLSLATALRGMRDNLRSFLWQPFALSLGLSMRSIGALSSLMDIVMILVAPVFGAASDFYGRKKFLILRDFLVLISGICFILANSWRLVSFGLILAGLSFALRPIWNSTVAESVESNHLGHVYGILSSFYMATGLVGSLSAGYLADNFGYSFVYKISSIFALGALFVTWFKIEETSQTRKSSKFTIFGGLQSVLNAFKPPRYLWGYYIAMSVDLFAFSIGWRLINGMLTEEFGFTPGMLGVMIAAQTGIMAISQMITSKYIDEVGYVKYLIISQLLACFLIALLLINQSFFTGIFISIIMGVSSALWGPAEVAWIAQNVDPNERARSLASYNTFRSIIAFPGPIIGGILFDKYGFKVPMLVNLIIALLDSALIYFLVDDNARH